MKTKLFTMMAAALLFAAATAWAQDSANSDVSSQNTDAPFCFVSGAGNASMTWCVGSHGNLSRFQSPSGFEAINVGTNWEGYVLCNGTSVLAYDIGSAEFNMAAGAVVTAGPTATGISIRRFTADGSFQIDQKFSRDNKENDVTIAMSVKRLGAGIADARLARVVDFDIDNDFGDDQQDRSDRGVWARDFHAVSLSNITFSQATDTSVSLSSSACSPASSATPTTIDGWSNVTARLGVMGTGNSKKTTFVYRRQ